MFFFCVQTARNKSILDWGSCHRPLYSGICPNGKKLDEVLTRASWTGVSVSVDAEGDCSDTIKGVKDWITACEMAVAMPSTMAALGVAMDVDVDADVVVATDLELVLVAVDVKAKGAARTRLTC